MKFIMPITVFTVSLLTISFSTSKLKEQVKKNQDGFALIELFTSEGCSSCPPADAILEEIQKKYSDRNVVILGYHVDYWDKLGWKDVFSDHLFTERQEYYSDIFRLNSIYTPQVVVNGETEFIGSNKNKLVGSIDERLNGKSSLSINLKANKTPTGEIAATYSIGGDLSKNEQVILLLVQKVATSKIKKGENEGLTLNHINIVRAITYLAKVQSTTSFDLPHGLQKEDVFIVCFIQDKKSGKVKSLTSSQIE